MTDDPHDGVTLLPSDDTGFPIDFLPTQMQKTGPNQMHFDLTSTSLDDQQQTVARSLGLGARHIDIGQLPEEVDRLISLGATRIDIDQGEVSWVVMADPDGNEFCVLTPR